MKGEGEEVNYEGTMWGGAGVVMDGEWGMIL